MDNADDGLVTIKNKSELRYRIVDAKTKTETEDTLSSGPDVGCEILYVPPQMLRDATVLPMPTTEISAVCCR
jgi:hypothetical protein